MQQYTVWEYHVNNPKDSSEHKVTAQYYTLRILAICEYYGSSSDIQSQTHLNILYENI